MSRRPLRAERGDVRLVGWEQGEGRQVVLLHGGPGLNYEYLDAAGDDLGEGYAVASYQQRGLAPSSEAGPFTVADHVADIELVLDTLGWERAVLVGHSWGGHLALQAATRIPGRLEGVLAVDTLGAVGDGGMQEFGATLMSRTPEEDVQRLDELDAKDSQGEAAVEDAIEGLALLWPAYFATRGAAPPMPEVRMGLVAGEGTMASAIEELPALEAALPAIAIPVGFLRGAGSPMPASASTDAADRIEGAWVESVPDAGHFVWLDAPGRLRAALDRLVSAEETGS